MSLACHKKSCLIFVEFSNFRNIAWYLFWFLLNVKKTETANRAETAAWKWMKTYSVIFRKFKTYKIAFLMTCQQHLSKQPLGFNRITFIFQLTKINYVNNFMKIQQYFSWFLSIMSYKTNHPFRCSPLSKYLTKEMQHSSQFQIIF